MTMPLYSCVQIQCEKRQYTAIKQQTHNRKTSLASEISHQSNSFALVAGVLRHLQTIYTERLDSRDRA